MVVKVELGEIFYEYAGFQDSVLFHQCSALVFNFKSVLNEKKKTGVA